MSNRFRSTATLPSFEDTRPAPYYAAAGQRPVAFAWSTATVTPAQPLPQDAWLIELPEIDPPRQERVVPLWLRVAGMVAAALLTLFALGLAASLLDAHAGSERERVAASGRS
jgi:hypothetical protein